MKFFKRLRSSNFWVSMLSAVILILQAVFNVEIKTEYLTQIIMAILGLLVMSGIVSDSSNDEVTVKQNVDMDSIKDNVTNILSQVATTFETNLTGVIKQFEVIKDNLNISSSQAINNTTNQNNVVIETVTKQETNLESSTEENNNEILNSTQTQNVETAIVVDEQNTL